MAMKVDGRPGEGMDVAKVPSAAITLEIQSKLDQVRLIRAAMSGVLAHLLVSEADIQALELAVTEVVNNCVEHGYGGREDGQIQVQIALCDSSVQVDVIDRAPAFPEAQRYRLLDEPMLLEDPTEEWSLRGHGLQIVRQIVDSIALRYESAQNILTMSKNVSRGAE